MASKVKHKRDTRTHVSSVLAERPASSPKVKNTREKMMAGDVAGVRMTTCVRLRLWLGLLDTAGLIVSKKAAYRTFTAVMPF